MRHKGRAAINYADKLAQCSLGNESGTSVTLAPNSILEINIEAKITFVKKETHI